MLFFAIIVAIWIAGCSVHQAQTKRDNVLSGQGSMVENEDDKNFPYKFCGIAQRTNK